MVKLKLKLSYVCFFLFVLASLLYLNLNDLPLSHPGNLKAADAFYHSLTTEGIIETKQWNYYPLYFSLGQEKGVNTQPPLYYLNSAILTLFSGIPVWSTLYFIVGISQAFFVVLIYLITKELFEDKKISVLTASLSVLPLSITYWLYGLYIGFWIQVPSYMFIMAFVWLFLRFIKYRETWTLFFLGLCLSSIMLLHIPDLVFLLFPTIWIGFSLLKEIKNKKIFLKKALVFGLLPLIIFITLTPRILFVWGSQGKSQADIGFYGFDRGILKMDNPVTPHFNVLPLWIRLLFFFGLFGLMFQLYFNISKKGFPKIQIKRNKIKIKKSKNRKLFLALVAWLFVSISYFSITYLSPIFVKDPYYIGGRSRALQPFFVFPFVGFSLYLILESIKSFIDVKKIRKSFETFSVIALVSLFVLISVPDYIKLDKNLDYEHISGAEWEAYKWLHQNTGKREKILFFDATFQSELLYTKRISASFPTNELQRAVSQLNKNKTLTSFNGHYAGKTVRAAHKYEKSFFEYGDFEDPSNNISIFEFDYVLFQDLNPQMAQINDYFASHYVNKYNFYLVYDKQGYMIIKNGK